MEEFRFKSKKTFYAATEGDRDASHLIYVLHGYGQLAQYFIRKFLPLPTDTYLVAPEGMHRFYLKGTSGRVGASWMTSHEREDDISDNISWLNDLHAQITANRSYRKISVIGFSQGGATAARWVNDGKLGKPSFTLWAAVFPPDVPFDTEFRKRVADLHFVLGTEDMYFRDAEKREELLSELREAGAQLHSFEGDHDIDHAVFTGLLAESERSQGSL